MQEEKENGQCEREQRAGEKVFSRVTERVRLASRRGIGGDGRVGTGEPLPLAQAALLERAPLEVGRAHGTDAREARRRSRSASAIRALKTWQRHAGAAAQVQRRQPQGAAAREARADFFDMG